PAPDAIRAAPRGHVRRHRAADPRRLCAQPHLRVRRRKADPLGADARGLVERHVKLRETLKKIANALPATAFIVALLGIVEALVRLDLVDKTFVPLPTAVLARTWEIVVTGAILAPLASTISLLFAGYFIGCIAAIILGLLMGNDRRVYN